jgi:peptidoglycan/xylan/chitin deacetylase (PgdA/CDA1 family)
MMAAQSHAMRPLLAALALLAAALAGPAAAEDVAITFDDLPTMALSPNTDYALATTKALIAGLKRHRIPATGFVNEIKLEARDKADRIGLLKQWLDAGMDLGNHTYDHPHFSTDVAAEIAEVEKGEVETRRLLAARGRAPHWFRHPYLETGATAQAQNAFEAWLGMKGYRVAAVSLENSDWLFAAPYDEAVMKGDTAEAARIKAAYLAFTAQIVPWYRQAALDVLGRRPSLVFLLHATRLNADSLDELAKVLADNRLTPVPLVRAMDDAAYEIPDDPATTNGQPWIARWALVLKKPMPWASLPRPPADIAAADARLEGGAAPKAAVPTPPKR